jgi:hypothetical protein
MAAYDIGEAFQIIEEEMIASMSRNLKRHLITEKEEGLNYSMWQAEQLAALSNFRKDNKKHFSKYFITINQQIGDVLKKTNESGQMEQEKTILEAVRDGLKVYNYEGAKSVRAQFFKINDRKMNALIKATKSDMAKAETAMLRMANDQYRKVIFNSEVYYNSGAGTLSQCVDMATKDFLSKGITCVEYANGARVGIDVYSRMALRTAQTRAYLQGEATKRDEWGINTVIVNRRGVACPLCLKWVGKVFYDDVWGSSPVPDPPKYPRLSEAIAGGLYHPNCKDVHTTYFEDISSPPKPMTQKEIDEANRVYALEQQQRYNERQIRKYKRLAMGSTDPETVLKYREKLTYWKERQADFISENSDVLKRRSELEKIFQLPDGLQFGHNSVAPTKDSPDTIKHEHTWVETIIKQPTCDKSGKKKLVCSCGEEKTYNIPALGHDYVSKVVAPTCTEKGYTEHICSRCGHTYKDSEKPALGHDFGDWIITRQPTATEYGRKQAICKRCGEKKYSTIPKLKGGTAPASPAQNKPKTPIIDYDDEALKIIQKQRGMDPAYEEVLMDHFETGSEAGKKAFIKYVPSDSVADFAHAGTDHFSPLQKKVNMNFAKDLTNARGAGTTFFHEHGHYIDFTAVPGKRLSHDPDFATALKADFDSRVKSIQKQYGCLKSEAYSRIARDVATHETHAVSDLCGGLSKNKARGWYGHDTKYWNNPVAVPQEAFAHMFDAEFNPAKRKLMEKYFPTAFAKFEELLGGIV